MKKLSNGFFIFRKPLLMTIMRTTIFLFCATVFAITPKNAVSKNYKINIKEKTSNNLLENNQQYQVSGTVTDEAGMPLPGATVVVKGTSNGVSTDFDGNYSISNVSENAILQFSYVGMKTKEVNVGNQTVINVQLASDVMGLDEVILVGYGTAGKKELTGAIGHLSVGDIDSNTFTSIDRAMQGKIPGVSISSDGAPGGRVDIRVRGLGTITNNEPLLLVDGVPVPNLNSVDPNVIQSVDVLKDASATAIYGNRASNGVVLITTKKGKSNQKAQIQANYQFGLSTMGTKLDLLNATQYKDIMNEAIDNAVTQGILSPGSVTDDATNFIPEDNDWQDEISRTAISNVASISGSGATENLSYYLSSTFRDLEGVIKGSSQKRISVTANSEFNLTDGITFGENFTFLHESLNTVPTQSPDGWGGVILTAAEATPQIPIGVNSGPGLGPIGTELGFYGNKSPLLFTRNENTSKALRSFGNAYLNFELLDGLEFKTQFGFNYSMVNSTSFEAYRYFPIPELDSSIGERFNTAQTLLWENYLTYSPDLEEHDLKILLGSSVQKDESKFFSADRLQLLNESPGFRYLDFGNAELAGNGGTGFKSSLQSLFARVNYGFKDKYFLTATIRADGSSRFTEDNRWGYFPSIGLGYDITEESFMENVSWVNFLKLRASWGEVGNQSIGSNYPYLDLIEPRRSNYVFGSGDGSIVNGTAESSRGNQDITWETTVMRNIGLDVTLFNNLSLTVEYFNNDTRDLLLPVQLADVGGFSAPPFKNIGTVNASGLELSTNFTALQNDDWDISVGLNGTFLKNEVTDLGETDFLIGNAGFNRIILPSNSPLRTVVGQPISSFFGYQMDGIFQNQAEIDASPTQNANTAPGDIKWKDNNNDGVIDADDRVFLGDGFPDFVYGINFSASYKDFDFSLSANGAAGVEIYNALRMDLMSSLPINKHVDILGRWTGEGTSNTIPRVVYNDPANNVRASDYFIESGDYLRLQTIQAGYTFHDLANLSSIRTYITVQNLHTFTKYSGSNPEVRAANGGAFQRDLSLGWDTGVYPAPRTFFIGLDITF